MTQIVQAGSINQLALGSPKAVVAIQTPTKPIIGAPSNILGMVGVASWGPVNVPEVVGGNDEGAEKFGSRTVRKYDLVSAIAVAVDQFCSSMRGVRVTDGTDVAASGLHGPSTTYETATVSGSITNGDTGVLHVANSGLGLTIDLTADIVTADTTTTVAAKLLAAFNASILPSYGLVASVLSTVLSIYFPAGWAFTRTSGSSIVLTLGTASGATALTFTALYTGTEGNAITVTLKPGTQASSTQALVNRPGYVSEKFDNITGAGNALYVAIAAAINSGNGETRGPSQLITATAGPSAAAAPAVATTVTLTLGTDGASGVVDASLLGVDTAPRKGLYALRNQGVSIAIPIDATDPTYWPNYASFGEGEGVLVEAATAAGDTLVSAATALSGAGVDSYGLKIDFGDWIYWWDEVNTTRRLLSPATFLAAGRANLSPEQSVLNKKRNNIIGSQKTLSGGVWSDADRDALYGYRLDLLANPAPGGAYWAAIGGINTSSNAAINGDNYTMMTNFIAKSVANWAGVNIGLLQTPDQRRDAKAAADDFFTGMWDLGMIGNADSAFGKGVPPWSVRIDDTTTSPELAAQGYEIAAVRVQYLAVIRWFIVNLMGGQTVKVTVSDSAPAFLSR